MRPPARNQYLHRLWKQPSPPVRLCRSLPASCGCASQCWLPKSGSNFPLFHPQSIAIASLLRGSNVHVMGKEFWCVCELVPSNLINSSSTVALILAIQQRRMLCETLHNWCIAILCSHNGQLPKLISKCKNAPRTSFVDQCLQSKTSTKRFSKLRLR